MTLKLHDLDRKGAVEFVVEGARMAEIAATSFTAEDVRLLGENIVTILRTVRSLTQPEVMQIADRVAGALHDAETRKAAAERRGGLFRALRDPDVRRGMTVMISVLRELGHEQDHANVPAEIAG